MREPATHRRGIRNSTGKPQRRERDVAFRSLRDKAFPKAIDALGTAPILLLAEFNRADGWTFEALSGSMRAARR
jgi:hypothetical protein